MSGLDSAARALATRAVQAQQGMTFVQIASRVISPDITLIQTTGHGTAGTGAGRYVADELATAALAAVNPRFCATDAGGRFFRLLPEGGAITAEQGGATGLVGSNDQPAIQAMLDYAAVAGIQHVKLGAAAYEVWCPVRTSSLLDGVAEDGLPLVVRGDMLIEGVAGKTRLTFKGPTGAVDRRQTVAGQPWRGGALSLRGTKVTRSALKNLILDGGLGFTYGDTLEVDLFDKGFCAMDGFAPNLKTIHQVDCADCGEPSTIRFSTCTLQSAWNPGTLAQVTAVNLQAGNARQPVEALMGAGHIYRGGRFYRGYSGSFMGVQTFGPGYPFSYPYRDPARAASYFEFYDTRFEEVDQLSFNSCARGTITMIDASIGIESNSRDIALDINFVCDRRGNNSIVSIGGPPTLTTQYPGADAGIYYQPPRNINLRISTTRTGYAKDHNIVPNGVFAFAGFLDSNSVTVELAGGEYGTSLTALGDFQAGHSLPLVRLSPACSFVGQPFGGNYDDLAADKTYRVKWAAMTFYQSSAGSRAVALDNAIGYAAGQRVRFLHGGGGAGDRVLTFARAGAGMRLNSDCSLTRAGEFLELEWSPWASGWIEAGRLSGAA